MIRVQRYPTGPRLWIAGQRIHHGSLGCLLLLGMLKSSTRVAALIGLALAYHDRRDWRRWLARDRILPATRLDRSRAYPVRSADHTD